MNKCTCLSAPTYHRSDCPIFDEWGNLKNNFRRNEHVLNLYLHRQKLVSHLMILEDDKSFYFFEVSPDRSRLFEKASATLTHNKKYSHRFDAQCCSFEEAHASEMLERLKRASIPFKVYKFDASSAQLVEKA